MRNTATRVAMALSVAALTASLAQAQVYDIKNFTTSGSGDGGNRTFVSTEFDGATSVFTAADVKYFRDGRLVNNKGSYKWNDVVLPTDFGTGGNDVSANPERGDDTTPFADPDDAGSLKEVFEGGNLGYLIDGEDNGSYTLDLLWGKGSFIMNDGNDKTVELVLLERGANSSISVAAILGLNADPMMYTLSTTTVIDFRGAGLTDYRLNTREIGAAQRVGGKGISLEAFGLGFGTKVYGFRLIAEGRNNNGPDIIGFAATNAPIIPEPSQVAFGLLSLASLGGLVVRGRRIKA